MEGEDVSTPDDQRLTLLDAALFDLEHGATAKARAKLRELRELMKGET